MLEPIHLHFAFAFALVETTDPPSYRNGTEALYSQFLDHLAKSGTANGASSNQEAKVLFAAMIGARLLAQAVGDAEWVRSLKSAVKAEAAQGAASLEVAPAPARTVR